MITVQPHTNETIALDATCFSRSIEVMEGAHVLLFCALTHGWDARQNLTVMLQGEGARFTCVFAFIGRGDTAFPFDLCVDHRARNTKSRVGIRSVLFDTSSVDSTGSIHIEKGAAGADTFFSHHALVLGEGAKAHAIPSLEIENDNVKAGHAVSIGRIPEEILFYSASRGIDRPKAEELFIGGFLNADAHVIEEREPRVLFEDLTSFNWLRGYSPSQ